MKVAICTSDGIYVDTHFGKTSSFSIFEFDGEKKIPIEKRKVDSYSPLKTDKSGMIDSHPFEQEKFDSVLEAINDCEILYTTAIGKTPQKKLEEKGVRVKVCQCLIDRI